MKHPRKLHRVTRRGHILGDRILNGKNNKTTLERLTNFGISIWTCTFAPKRPTRIRINDTHDCSIAHTYCNLVYETLRLTNITPHDYLLSYLFFQCLRVHD